MGADTSNRLTLELTTTPDQAKRLLALQSAFAEVCNALAPQVQMSHCWNRVALHRMAYKGLREQFPAMGSQMVCNAIYSVSRAARMVFQHPHSPFQLDKIGQRRLPLLHFSNTCPVYFDRHTLSLKDGRLSMYTLDGRMRFYLELKPEDEANFHQAKLREVVLSRNREDRFNLSFCFWDEEEDEGLVANQNNARKTSRDLKIPAANILEMPEYLMVQETA